MKKDRLEVILDFDYTIFDAARFRRALARSLVKLGIPSLFFLKYYHRAIKRYGGHYSYQPDLHLELLRKKYPDLSIQQGHQALKMVIRSSEQYLYPSAIKFLKSLKKLGFSLILVTHGNPSFQKQKINYSGVKKYFDRVTLSQDMKIVTLKRIEKTFGRSFFISDHINELMQIQRHLPKLLPIMKIGSHHSDAMKAKRQGIPTFRTLRQIENYIVRQIKVRVY